MNPAILKAEQELQELRVQEAVVTESARLLTAQKEWLGDLIQQLAELSRMVRDQEHITPAEAQSWYFSGQVAKRSWYRAAETGLVPCVHFGGKVLFRRADLDRLELEGTLPTAPPASPLTPPAMSAPKPKPTTVTVFKHFPR